MISWILIAVETAAMFAILWLLEGKKYQRAVMLGFACVAVVVSIVALVLADEPTALMEILCVLVPVYTCSHLPKKRKK